MAPSSPSGISGRVSCGYLYGTWCSYGGGYHDVRSKAGLSVPHLVFLVRKRGNAESSR